MNTWYKCIYIFNYFNSVCVCASFTLLFTVCRGKMNFSSRQDWNCYKRVPVDVHVLIITIKVEMGVFRQVAIFATCLLAYKDQRTSPSFGLCALLKKFDPCVTSYFYPSYFLPVNQDITEGCYTLQLP